MLKKYAVELLLKQKQSKIINVSNGYTASVINGFLVVRHMRQGADGLLSGGDVFIEEDGTYPEYKIPTADDLDI